MQITKSIKPSRIQPIHHSHDVQFLTEYRIRMLSDKNILKYDSIYEWSKETPHPLINEFLDGFQKLLDEAQTISDIPVERLTALRQKFDSYQPSELSLWDTIELTRELCDIRKDPLTYTPYLNQHHQLNELKLKNDLWWSAIAVPITWDLSEKDMTLLSITGIGFVMPTLENIRADGNDMNPTDFFIHDLFHIDNLQKTISHNLYETYHSQFESTEQHLENIRKKKSIGSINASLPKKYHHSAQFISPEHKEHYLQVFQQACSETYIDMAKAYAFAESIEHPETRFAAAWSLFNLAHELNVGFRVKDRLRLERNRHIDSYQQGNYRQIPQTSYLFCQRENSYSHFGYNNRTGGLILPYHKVQALNLLHNYLSDDDNTTNFDIVNASFDEKMTLSQSAAVLKNINPQSSWFKQDALDYIKLLRTHQTPQQRTRFEQLLKEEGYGNLLSQIKSKMFKERIGLPHLYSIARSLKENFI